MPTVDCIVQSLSFCVCSSRKSQSSNYRNFWGEIELASGEPFATARPVSVSEGFLRTVSLMLFFFVCVGWSYPGILSQRQNVVIINTLIVGCTANRAIGVRWGSICSTWKCGFGCGMVCEQLSRFFNACEAEGDWPFSPSKGNVGQHAPVRENQKF